MAAHKMFRDLGLNDNVVIELPVHNAIAAIAEYVNMEDSGDNLNVIVQAILKEVLDPLFMKEREAALQEEHDQAQAAKSMMAHIVHLHPPPDEDIQ